MHLGNKITNIRVMILNGINVVKDVRNDTRVKTIIEVIR